MGYDPRPCYPLAEGAVELGHAALAGDLASDPPAVLALDGAAALPWSTIVSELTDALAAEGIRAARHDLRQQHADWEAIVRRTTRAPLADDPVFASLHDGPLSELFDSPPRVPPPSTGEVAIAFGPGAALVPHDRLWYCDVPKREMTAAVQRGEGLNLGQRPGATGELRRLMFIDWPMLDRHKREWLGRWDRYVDLSDAARPRSVRGPALRASLRALAGRPFRTVPSFAPGPWGGQWLRRVLGIATDGPNLAWSYELIAPESSVLLGSGDEAVEVGFELLLSAAGEAILGGEVEARFGSSFPIRFDYLDTMDGGNLSVHCHPRPEYMRDVFGWAYTQHETYYVMETRPGSRIFLGLAPDADLDAFEREARRSQAAAEPLEIERFVPTVAARRHGLYLIPAGTPHASSEGNVVLEISATPYLYSLRFYDWLRADLDGTLRPVQLHHAFANLEPARRGAAASGELVPEPSVLREGDGWRELDLGGHRELFFGVRRLEFEETIEDATHGRFHVLNLVEGDEIVIETGGVEQRLSYGETLLVPAAVDRYRLRAVAGGPFKVVKALVLPESTDVAG